MKSIVEKIKNAQKIAIFNHENPDGDALGSAFALKLIMIALGKKAEVFLRQGDERTREYKLVKGTENNGLSVEECDLKVAVDCADIKRLGTMKEFFSGNTAAIDHHMTHVEFAESTLLVDAPATGEIIFDLAEMLGVELTHDMAHNIYVAITCDTGSFKYSSTTPKTHVVAAKLLEKGVDIGYISKCVFDTKSFDYFRAYRKGIDSLELFENGKIAVLSITEEDFKELGVDETIIDGIVELPRSVEGAEVGAYIRQREDGAFKVSLRSNGDVDVAKAAVAFGGGGHIKASGFLLRKELEIVKEELVAEIKKQL
ncbi:MAG: bifunctional oligoribonuclease/PAP phosphatase NrnA [Ruminococcaceae bacterium]|nr:bifunctional oligoribonuclease/PAP phosphatase NrnA [Oscillospiraceae bacterium]